MSLMNSRDEFPLDMSPRFLHLGYIITWCRDRNKEKIVNKNDYDTNASMQQHIQFAQRS